MKRRGRFGRCGQPIRVASFRAEGDGSGLPAARGVGAVELWAPGGGEIWLRRGRGAASSRDPARLFGHGSADKPGPRRAAAGGSDRSPGAPVHGVLAGPARAAAARHEARRRVLVGPRTADRRREFRGRTKCMAPPRGQRLSVRGARGILAGPSMAAWSRDPREVAVSSSAPGGGVPRRRRPPLATASGGSPAASGARRWHRRDPGKDAASGGVTTVSRARVPAAGVGRRREAARGIGVAQWRRELRRRRPSVTACGGGPRRCGERHSPGRGPRRRRRVRRRGRGRVRAAGERQFF